MAEIRLYQFPSSHFNEKARWALDWKRVPHERVSLMPGPHLRTVRKLTGGTTVPVLVEGDRAIPESADILDHLERRFPEPPLYPEDPAERERALAIQRDFDREVGPAVRLAKFFELMSAAYATRVFCSEQPAHKRALYRAMFPMVAALMKRKMEITPANAARARERTREALDFVAKEAGPEGLLVGGRFSVADLTCASLLMPAVELADVGGPSCEPSGEKVEAWYTQWRDHPGAAWVREIYGRWRLPSGAA